MNKRLKRQGIIGLAAIAALTFTLPVHAQDEDEIKKNNAKGDTLTFNVSDFVLPEGANLDRLLRKLPGVTYYSSGSVEFDGITIKEMTVETRRNGGQNSRQHSVRTTDIQKRSLR